MNRKSFTILIKRFLSGKTTPEENDFLQRYDNLFDSKALPEEPADESEEYGRQLFEQIRLRIANESEKKVIRLTQFRVLLRAASIVLLLGASVLAYTYRNDILLADPVQYSTIHVAPGKTAKVLLADGTSVLLNAGSTLTYPDKFRGVNREVALQGEGYFQVTRKSTQPFIVSTPALHVKVLGTSFNVRSYQDDQKLQVSVVSGKVQVNDARNNMATPVMLTAREEVSYLTTTGTFEKGEWDGTDELSWLDGGLNFRNRSFREVANALERRFGITVQLDPNLENCNVYAQIGNEPVTITLKALTRLMGAKLTSTENGYRISGVGCQSN